MEITVTLNTDDIKDAITKYLENNDIIRKDNIIEVNMVAGRGSNGHSAVISIKREGDVQESPPMIVEEKAEPVTLGLPPESIVDTKPNEEANTLFEVSTNTPMPTLASEADNNISELDTEIPVIPQEKEEVASLFN